MRNVARILFLAWLVSLTTGVSIGAQRAAQQTRAADRFVGVWRLVFMEQDGKPDPTRGERPTGLIFYSATGHMAAQIMPDRRRPSWPASRLPTPEQALDAVTGYAAYFGTYSVDERAQTVTHHRQGALNLDVVDYVRRYEFEGNDRLILFPQERSARRLIWERIK